MVETDREFFDKQKVEPVDKSAEARTSIDLKSQETFAKKEEMFVKYLQPSDLVEQQIGIDSKNADYENRLTKMLYALIDFMNTETVCQ